MRSDKRDLFWSFCWHVRLAWRGTRPECTFSAREERLITQIDKLIFILARARRSTVSFVVKCALSITHQTFHVRVLNYMVS